MRYLNVTGIILRKQNRGENDFYLTIMSPEIGKFEAYSRASRKITSQKGAHLDTLNVADFQVYTRDSGYLITQCQCSNAHLDIRENYQKTVYAQHILEIFNKGTAGGDSAKELFALLEKTLSKISQSNQYDFILEEFKLRFLQILGTLPEIAYCFYSGKRWSNDEKIWIDHEGHLCSADSLARSKGPHEHIPFSIMKLINFITAGNEVDHNIKIKPQDLLSLKTVTDIFLRNYLHQEIKTEQLLNTCNL